MVEEKNSINNKIKGHLVLIGGAEDKRDDKLVLKKMVEINNAKEVVIIPSASSYPTSLSEEYLYAFRDLGVEGINIFDIRERREADKEAYIEMIQKADLIFFTGGDQVKLVDTLDKTKLIDEIKRSFINGCIVAGTSAGAAAASDHMIYDGDEQGLIKGKVRTKEGFGFVKNITIDTHFIARDRLLRLSQFLSAGTNRRGIGLGEDTAIIIYPNGHFEVIGKGVITVVDSEKLTYSNYEKIDSDNLLNMNGLKVGFLQQGSIFDMKNWKVISSCLSDSDKIPIEMTKPRMNL